MNVVLFSYHYYNSRRRAGFHWLADAYHRLGANVTFVTAPISVVSVAHGDHRVGWHLVRELRRPTQIRPGFSTYVHFTAIHPVSLRLPLLDRLAEPLFERYRSSDLTPIAADLMRAELVLVESGPSLLLIDQLRARAPAAKFVYRVSDGLDRAGSPPFIRRAERSLAARFDLISVPSRHLLRSFEGLSRVRLQPHGIELELFREETPTPYDQGHNACFVGVSHFDHNALRVLSDARRDWSFHILGPIRRKVRAPNVLYYGERPFAETVPYIKHADVGLETVVRHEGMETLRESSLKMLQFEHCGVPIIAPSELRHPRPGVFFYDRASPASLLAAFASAERFRHSNGRAITTRSWLDVARDIIEVA